MATNFPGAIDTFTNPSSGQFLNSPSHSLQHDNINDAMAAVQAKLGATGSAVTTSHTYKLSGVTGSDLAVSKTGAETLTNKTLTAPIIATILNSGTLTLPTSTDTLVGRATTDILTNKTLTSPKVGTSILDTNGALLITVSATASAVNGISIVNSATGNDPQILPGGSDSARHLNLRGKGLAKTVTIGAGGVAIFAFDYVASGLVITADNVGVNKNYSVASGVVVINGNPVTVAAVSAQTVGASQDRYIDILDNGDGTGIYVTTEVANNSASPALAANSIRIGIVVAGATTIAATTSINQGQETRVLPIASSIAYSVQDSIGNLICGRDPHRKLLGYRQIISTFSTASATSVQITGLTCPIIAGTNRKVLIRLYTRAAYNGTGTTTNQQESSIWDGVVSSGTCLQQYLTLPNGANNTGSGVNCEATVTPSTTSKTYNGGFLSTGGGTANFQSTGATNPAFIRVGHS